VRGWLFSSPTPNPPPAVQEGGEGGGPSPTPTTLAEGETATEDTIPTPAVPEGACAIGVDAAGCPPPWEWETNPEKLKDQLREMHAKIQELEETGPLIGPKQLSEEEKYMELREREIVEGLTRLSNQEKVGVDAVELMRMFYTMFFNKEQQKPVFLVTFGPPGSGKSWILKRVAQHYNYDIEANFVKVLQDDMMKNIKAYNDEMEALGLDRPKFKDAEGNLTQGFYDRADQIYWKYRNMVIQMKNMLLDVAYRQVVNAREWVLQKCVQTQSTLDFRSSTLCTRQLDQNGQTTRSRPSSTL